MAIKTGRMVELQPCACGCGTTAHWHQLHVLRDSLGHSFFVLDDCRAGFERELDLYCKLKQITQAFSGSRCWSRWKMARAWYALQFGVRVRTKGEEIAARIARRDTLMFVLPNWLARMYARMLSR